MADLIYIDGIGQTYKKRVIEAGYPDIEAMLAGLEAGPDAVSALAVATKAAANKVEHWLDHAQLFHLTDMDEAAFRMLNQVMVRELTDLQEKDAVTLHAQLAEVNAREEISEHYPSLKLVETWIQEALHRVEAAEVTGSAVETGSSVETDPSVEEVAPSTELVVAGEGETTEDHHSGPSVFGAEFAILNYSKKVAQWALLPIPVADLVAVNSQQQEMIRELAEMHKTAFSRADSLAAIKGLVPPRSSMSTLTSLVKVVPFLGTLSGGVSGALTHATETYGIGKTLHDHFSSGGTLADFDAKAMHTHYRKYCKMGMELLKSMIPVLNKV